MDRIRPGFVSSFGLLLFGANGDVSLFFFALGMCVFLPLLGYKVRAMIEVGSLNLIETKIPLHLN